MKIAVFADLHYSDHPNPDHPRRRGEIALELLDNVIDSLNGEHHPDLAICAGDLVNEPERADLLPEVVRHLKRLRAPLIVIPGNHDPASEEFYRHVPRPPVFLDLGGIRFIPFTDDPERPGWNAARTPEEIEQYKAKNLWAFEEKENELPAKQPLINLEAFRRHALAYLRQREELNQEMPLMIRQLQPTSEGLPLEIYCFTTVKDWIPYEDIQTSIFNHLIGVLPEFSLRLYQKPAELIYKDADDADKSLIKN